VETLDNFCRHGLKSQCGEEKKPQCKHESGTVRGLFSHDVFCPNDGAAPKETTSESESNSTPNELEDLVIRAITPSSVSKSAARMMNQAAWWNAPWAECTIAL
jgi:hypothetical protein